MSKALNSTAYPPRVLIVEDEYYLADDLKRALLSEGAEIVGPIGDLSEALGRAVEGDFNAAIIDIDLHGQAAYSIADVLAEQLIPFVFATGYGAQAIPKRFWEVTRFEKPCDAGHVASYVVQLTVQRRTRQAS